MHATVDNSNALHSVDTFSPAAKIVDSPKHDRRLRMRSAPSRFSSKTESSGSSSDTPIHEECDACEGNKGGLVTCENCFGAYHLECLNPSLSREEMEKMQETDLYCSHCSSMMCSSKAGLERLSSSSDIIECGSPRKSPRANRSADSSPTGTPKSKRKKCSNVCETCDQNGVLITCILCSKSYHSFCVDPPLLEIPTHWQCSDHETNVALVPRQTFRLNFTPNDWDVDDTSRVSLLDNLSTQDSTQTNGDNSLSSIGGNNATNRSLCDDEKDCSLQANKRHRTDSIDVTKSKEESIIGEDESTDLLLMLKASTDLAMSFESLIPDDAKTSVSPLVLKQLSPNFIQFLAWQRLTEIYQDWQHRATPKTPSH